MGTFRRISDLRGTEDLEQVNQFYVGVGVGLEPTAFRVVDRKIQLQSIVQDLSNPVTEGDKITQVKIPFDMFCCGAEALSVERPL